MKKNLRQIFSKNFLGFTVLIVSMKEMDEGLIVSLLLSLHNRKIAEKELKKRLFELMLDLLNLWKSLTLASRLEENEF